MRQEGNEMVVVSYQVSGLNMNKNEIIASFAFAKKGANIHMEEGERGALPTDGLGNQVFVLSKYLKSNIRM